LLDEESSFPSATDDSLVTKFHENNAEFDCYEKPHGAAKEFTIVHYAGKVTYKASGFLDKNSDSLNDSVIALFKDCQSTLIASWFEKDQDMVQARGTLKKGYKPPTVSGQFKESLALLMTKLESTDPYFIRCIKPNAEKRPNEFNAEIVLKQLRNTGMLETIRIRRLGYPLRLTFNDFYGRFYMLKPDLQTTQGELKDRCLLITNFMRLNADDFQLGTHKVFLRTGGQKILEDQRHKIITAASLRVTYFLKAATARNSFLRKKAGVIQVQKMMRGFLARRHYRVVRAGMIRIQSSMSPAALCQPRLEF